MASSKFSHQLAGQHVYKDMLWARDNPQQLLAWTEHMTVHDDDVFVCSYPKSGTTWLQEIVWLVKNNADTKQADEIPNTERVLFIEHLQSIETTTEDRINSIENMPQPRCLKSHLPHQLMPREAIRKKVKMVAIMRNPKDTIVSYYNFYRMNKGLGSYSGTFSTFYDMFIEAQVKYGSWFDHVLGWWTHRHDPNVLILKFEDLLKDHKGAILEVAKFLGVQLNVDQVNKIVSYTTFESMKSNKGTSLANYDSLDQSKVKFYGKGKVGNWKNYFTVAQNEHFEKVHKDKIAGSGLKFDFE